MRNYRNYRARNLKTGLERRRNHMAEAERIALETLSFDVTDYGARYEMYLLYKATGRSEQAAAALKELERLLGDEPHNYLSLAEDYAMCGMYEEAAGLLSRFIRDAGNKNPMVLSTLGFCLKKQGLESDGKKYDLRASQSSPDYCFPNTLFHLIVLQDVAADNPSDSYALYYMGNLLYDKKRHEKAMECWEGKVIGQYVHSCVEVGKQLLQQQHYEQALSCFEKAFSYPSSLGEGKLYGDLESHVHYYLGCCYEGLGQTNQMISCYQTASCGLDEPVGAMYYNDQPPDMIFYQGLALKKLRETTRADSRFNKLIAYGESHFFDNSKIDYFAVSLPDFLIFDDDLNKRNVIHCRYMIVLGLLGLGNVTASAEQFSEVITMDPSHQGP